jgi:hypothetical protein
LRQERINGDSTVYKVWLLCALAGRKSYQHVQCEITIFLARDSAGLIPLTSDRAAEASQVITLGAAVSTAGGVSFIIGKDYHFDTTVTNATSGTIYVAAKTNTNCTATNVRLNWRA